MADSLIQSDNQSDERAALIAKWKDKPREELEAAKAESDLYIKTLTNRFDDLSKDYMKLREEHQASTDLKELIKTLKEQQTNPDTSTTTQVEPQAAIKPEDIRSLVSEQMVQHQNQMKQQENFKMVQGKLKEVFGDNYVIAYKQRLDQLGISPEYADVLAKEQPKVFLKTFDLEAVPNKTMNILPPNQQRQTSFAPTTQKRDWAYYQEMKKSNPKLYLDPKIANQMHDDAIALGDAFGMPQD